MTFMLDTADTGGTFTPVPAGIHLAVCLYVADLGTQVGNYGPKPTLLFTFEIPGLLAADGKPMQISRRFGKTLNEKGNLRPFLQSWVGQPLTAAQIDIARLAGRPAMLVVSQSQNGDRTYSNITACAPVQPGTPVPAPSVQPLCYGPDRDPATFAALPEWVRKAVTAGGAAPAGAALGFTPAATFSPAPAYVATPPAMPTAPAQPAAQMQTAPPTNAGMPFDDALNF
jgi:hypothetical protein